MRVTVYFYLPISDPCSALITPSINKIAEGCDALNREIGGVAAVVAEATIFGANTGEDETIF